MKKPIITIFSLLVAFTAHAQTFNGTYKSQVTDHVKNGSKFSSVTKFKGGRCIISPNTITLDTASFTVLKHGNLEIADENYFTQSLMAVTMTKKGAYKVYDIVLLIKPDKKTITDVVLKKSKATTVSYVLD